MSNSKREDLSDKFYTKEKVASLLIDEVNIDNFEYIIEPSAGKGAFSSQISDCIALDIDPKSEEIVKKNFFNFKFNKDPEKTLVIGNPPYGRQGSKALSFIRKASKIADNIGFILPKSFKKSSMKTRVPEYFHLEKEIDISDGSFVYRGEDYEVPSVFQVWKRKDNPRKSESKVEPLGFSFVDKDEDPDFSVRRVGVYAGEANLMWEEKSEESHYFVYLDLRIKRKRSRIVQKLNEVEFRSIKFTSGPNSLSKRVLTKKLNEIIESNTKMNKNNFW